MYYEQNLAGNQFGGDVLFYPTRTDKWEALQSEILQPVSGLTDNCRGIGPQEMARAIQEGRPNRDSKEMAYHVLETLNAILASGKDGSFHEVHSTFMQPDPMDAVLFMTHTVEPNSSDDNSRHFPSPNR